jgi:hypothetical protein
MVAGLGCVALGLFHMGLVHAEYQRESSVAAVAQETVDLADLKARGAENRSKIDDHERRIVALEQLRIDARLTVIEYVGYATLGLLLTILGALGAWFVQAMIKQVIRNTDD